MRRTFFSFHYKPDVTRAWVVRNSWVLKSSEKRAEGFFDSSVFEASRRESPEALKRFLRDGLMNTSVTCVLAGTDTWRRRWVRYEIARSLIRGNGLLTVYVHGIRNFAVEPSSQGINPLARMGVYKANGAIHLCEKFGDSWRRYRDYRLAIDARDLPFPAPTSTTIIKLSDHYSAYNYARQSGHQNIGSWIEMAARAAGR